MVRENETEGSELEDRSNSLILIPLQNMDETEEFNMESSDKEKLDDSVIIESPENAEGSEDIRNAEIESDQEAPVMEESELFESTKQARRSHRGDPNYEHFKLGSKQKAVPQNQLWFLQKNGKGQGSSGLERSENDQEKSNSEDSIIVEEAEHLDQSEAESEIEVLAIETISNPANGKNDEVEVVIAADKLLTEANEIRSQSEEAINIQDTSFKESEGDEQLSGDEDDDIIIDEINISTVHQEVEEKKVIDIHDDVTPEKVKKNLFQEENDLSFPLETLYPDCSIESTNKSEDSSVDVVEEISVLDVTVESSEKVSSLPKAEEDGDEIEILEVSISQTSSSFQSTQNKAKLNASANAPPPPSSAKCPDCRQRLDDITIFKPIAGVGEAEVAASPEVNIVMDMDMDMDDDSSALQYKITDFAIYDRVGESGGHLVPIFAENLLSTNKKIYLAGRVLRLDQEEEEAGLNVRDIGPITAWHSVPCMEGQENIIISTKFRGRDMEYNLFRPAPLYTKLFVTAYRMAFLANKIISELADCCDRGMERDYEGLLEFVNELPTPVLYGEKLTPCDDEFLLFHSDFIVSQASSWEEAGETEEDVSILAQPCLRHMADMAGVQRSRAGSRQSASRGRAGPRNTPQPEVHIKAQTTPLVAELFESTFQAQMKRNKAVGAKLCTCRTCQAGNCGSCERCREMVSFGGSVPDSQLVCLERQCLRRTDKEVVLGDDETETEAGMAVRHRVRMVGGGSEHGKDIYYEAAEVKLGGKWTRFQPGSFLLVTPDPQEHRSVQHYPARVLHLLKRRGTEIAHVQWLARAEETVLGRTGEAREWFLVPECEDILLRGVSKPLDISRVRPAARQQFVQAGGTSKAIPPSSLGGQDGFWKMKYLPEFGRFVYPNELELELRPAGQCSICDIRNEAENEDEVKVSNDGKQIRIKNKYYTLGEFIMLEDETIQFKVPKRENKIYRKEERDQKTYPEDWRKPEFHKGDHHDTFDPFQVVRLEQIVQEGGAVYLRVRLLYRPHDTTLRAEEARSRPYTELYWSGEVGRLHPAATAAGRASLESVVGPAWVRPASQDTETKELMDWTDAGEDRFFIAEQFSARSRQFSPLPAEVVTALETELAAHPAPALPPVASKLDTMDIFAGCGGLSSGLHQAGITRHKWAIEFWKPAADAFQLNNPDCSVMNQECNSLLKEAMDGKDGTRMPDKGEVDLMVGGPPCQGFSLLNIYKEREYSKFKNSLIPTYLSFCDWYRPKFYILENVRNLVANEGGMVLKLILATLVKMGYQVGFNVLQAGHYGVAQTRRRLIVMAAAPEETLPLYPEPLYNFPGPHFSEVDVDRRKFSTTTRRPGAPRRALTVWDTLSDLPAVPSGHSRPAVPYLSGPESHLQHMFRGRSAGHVEDHICKDVNALCLERIKHIPRGVPGADWRDLPNTVVRMEDGRQTRKLHYPYRKADGRRGVCSCCLSTKQKMTFCDADDKQSENLIAWSLPHTADRHNNWSGVYGRVDWEGIFKTTITDPEPLGKQGQVLHPTQDRLLSVREYARSQGFSDSHKFSGTIRDKHREIGNAVPPPLGKAIGLEIRKIMKSEK